ncbi:MAG: MBL fold metallo-hydrolase [Peptostreptococcaceae bacterium]
MKFQKIVEPNFGENMYVLYDEKSKECAVIDPGGAIQKIFLFINTNKLNLKYILLTHGHGDHIGAVNKIKETYKDVQVVSHIDEKELLNDSKKNLSYSMHCGVQSVESDIYLKDRDKLKLGGETITFIHTPGHTPGGSCIRVNDDMFTGDTIFAGNVGRCDLFGGNFNTLKKSLKKIQKFEDNVRIHPGHGPSSTIGQEKMTNPYM